MRIGRFTWKFPLLRHMWSSERGLSIFLGLLVTVLFVLFPIMSVDNSKGVIIQIVFSLILVSGVAAVSENRVLLAAVWAIASLAVVIQVISIWERSRSIVLCDAWVAMVFLSILTGTILSMVFKEGPITPHRIVGAVAAYLLIATLWADIYFLIDLNIENAFHFSDSDISQRNSFSEYLYFSFVCITTVGFGEITPVHPFARAMVNLEGFIGQLFPAVFLGYLVSLHTRTRANLED